ncbi:MAG: UPF0182 family protein [Gemmatimonadetes bacterium]|nr:UPF0182 family protein [Gemmatimonadota bacterium]
MSQPSRRAPIRWGRLAIIAALGALLAGRWLADRTADRLWAEAVGAASTHAALASLRFALWAVALAAASIWCVGNVYLFYRSIGSVHVPRRLGNIEILEAVPHRYLLWGAVILGLLLALLLSHQAGDWWYVRSLLEAETALGVPDPVLGRDLAYYLFVLPWHRTLHAFATLLAGILLAVTALLYAGVGAVRWSGRRLQVSDLARMHLAGLFAAFALTLFWGYRLEPAEYVAGIHQVSLDATLADVRIPVAGWLSVLALLTAALSLAWLWLPNLSLLAGGWVFLAAVSLVGHHVLPPFTAMVRGEAGVAAPELSRSAAELERLAYGPAARDTTVRPPARHEAHTLNAHAGVLRAAPVWDAFAADTTISLRARSEPYYRFTDATLGLYRTAQGQAVPVYLSVREIDLNAARESGADLTWERIHTIPFGHATGAVVLAAGAVSEDGAPYFLSGLEPVDSVAPRDTMPSLTDDRVFFSPGASEFTVVAANPGEFVGVPSGGFGRRVALAWALQSPRLVTSALISPDVLILWERAVGARLARFAPFAHFGTPYPVRANGRLHWVASGYVAAEGFPLVRSVRWHDESVRYLRAGFIGIVEARSGATHVYLVPAPDPVSAAWARLAPRVVRPFAALPPAIAAHLRYPEDLFRVQLGLLGKGATARPSRPERPGRLGRTGAGELAAPRDAPLWWVGPWAGDTAARLRLTARMDPEDASATSGLAQGTVVDGDPRLEVIRFELPVEPVSPADLTRRLADLRSPTVGVYGARRIIPLGDGVLVLQSAYATGEGPLRLVDVIVQWGPMVARGSTLAAALASAASTPAGPPPGGQDWLEARRWFERLDQARQRGDWGAFGRAYEELRKLLAGPRRAP